MEVFPHWIDDFLGGVPGVLLLQCAVLGWGRCQNPTRGIIGEGSARRTVYVGAGTVQVSG